MRIGRLRGRTVVAGCALTIVLLVALAVGGLYHFTATSHREGVSPRSSVPARENKGGDAASPSVIEGRDPEDPVARVIIEGTNRERLAAGLGPLFAEARLCEIAMKHSQDMLDREFFDHTNPDGEDPSSRVAWQHRRLVGTVGENIGKATQPASDSRLLAATFVAMWMKSPGHRENILTDTWNAIGVGVASQGNTWTATQVFANVQGYFADDLPGSIDVTPNLRFKALLGKVPAVAYDISSEANDEAVTRQRSFNAPSMAGEVLPAGTFRVRVYVPDTPSRFSVFPGPRFRASRQR